jgi:hypothetical protein
VASISTTLKAGRVTVRLPWEIVVDNAWRETADVFVSVLSAKGRPDVGDVSMAVAVAVRMG